MASNNGSETHNGDSNSDASQLPLVTIITATYNAEKYLRETINSVIDQTYSNIEFIVIDGQSSDSTTKIIKEFETHIAYWVSEKDRGVYDAWNKALAIAKGEWICFLGADDILTPNAIEDYIQHINSLKGYKPEFVSSKAKLVSHDLTFIREKGEAWHWNKFKVYMTCVHVGALHHRELFKKFGIYDTKYKVAADYELILRAQDSLKASFLNKHTVLMRVGGLSNNFRVFEETYNAKVFTANRSAVACRIEYLVAISKYLIRKVIG